MNDEISQAGYINIFNNSPVAQLIMKTDAPIYTIIAVNDAYLSSTNTSREALIGQSVFAAFPGNPTDQESKNIERTKYSFEEAIRSRSPHTMSNYRYDIPIPGTNEFEERYWTTTNIPVLDEQGEVSFFIHSPNNVTELIKLEQREMAGIEALKTQRKQLYSLLMQVPVGIGIFKGPNYLTELINKPLCDLYGKSSEEMMGQPIFEVLSFVKGLGYEELADQVRLTGQTYHGKDQPIP
ncbi:MAG: PAS domain-containing protein, partial [Sphingobacteriales bacterium]